VAASGLQASHARQRAAIRIRETGLYLYAGAFHGPAEKIIPDHQATE